MDGSDGLGLESPGLALVLRPQVLAWFRDPRHCLGLESPGLALVLRPQVLP